MLLMYLANRKKILSELLESNANKTPTKIIAQAFVKK